MIRQSAVILAGMALLFLAGCQKEGPVVTSTASTSSASQPAGGPMAEDLDAQGIKPLDNAALRALFERNRTLGTNLVDGLKVQMSRHRDGTFDQTIKGVTKTLAYEIRDNKRCSESVLGSHYCLTLYRVGDQTYACDPRDGGSCDWSIETVN